MLVHDQDEVQRTLQSILELKTKSLRETLVPANEWFKQFQKLECESCPIPTLINMPDQDRLRGYWMAPYPYRIPIYIRFLADWFPDKAYVTNADLMTLDQEDYQDLVESIAERLAFFTGSMLSEDQLAEIDAIEDYGVIIQSSTGTIRPFEYSELRGFDWVNLPLSAEYAVAAAAKNLTSLEYDDYVDYVSDLYDNRYDFESWIVPKFRTKKGDRFNDASKGPLNWSITTLGYIDAGDILAIQEYLQRCVDLRCKVMFIP